MAQSQNGTTLNANISVNAITGSLVFTFNDPFNMLINLLTSADVSAIGSTHNDKFNLMNATGVTVSGSNGNNIYAIAAATGSLNGNMLRGGSGMDFVTIGGGAATVDFTATVNSGLEAVIGNKNFSGQTVTVSLNQLVSSALTNGGTGRAFASVIGTDGVVNVVQSGKFKFVGVIDSAGNGYDATGQAISGAALTGLSAQVTSISKITGNLAAIYAGSTTGKVPAGETEVSQALNAYVFSDGTKSYTVWTDGTVTPTTATGTPLDAIFHPSAVAPTTPFTYQSVATFNQTDPWAGGNIFNDANGVTNIRMVPGNTGAATAIVLKTGVTGMNVLGDTGLNGANYFGLGQSGGNNKIVGSKAGNVFDLQLSTSLQDKLVGGNGFDIVKAAANGADVDLTANNGATGTKATLIDAVVGSSNVANIQTVEYDVSTARYTLDSTGAKVGAFTALLGSADDTLFLFGSGKWVEVATFDPLDPLPLHASALSNAAALNAEFGRANIAETTLHGHLYEQVDLRGNPVKFLTVYTDATIDSHLAAPAGVVVI